MISIKRNEKSSMFNTTISWLRKSLTLMYLNDNGHTLKRLWLPLFSHHTGGLQSQKVESEKIKLKLKKLIKIEGWLSDTNKNIKTHYKGL